MPDREPEIQTFDTAAARDRWPDLLARVARRETRFIVEEDGVPVAAIMSVEEFRRLSQLEARRRADFAILGEMQAAFADVPDEEVEREIARALAEVRAAARERTGQAALRTVAQDGDAFAPVVPPGAAERPDRGEGTRADRFRALAATQAAFRDRPDEEIEREVERAIAEVRAENRARARGDAARTA